jgi:D-alanine-D-alanine ligase
VSIRSAASVIDAIDRQKYEVVPIAISREGKWLSPAAAFQLLPTNAQSLLPATLASGHQGAVAILGDPSHSGLLYFEQSGGALTSQKLDVVFPVLHGPFGEDGTLQGLLEMANVPYVGCGVLASACGMDKVAMKLLFLQAGLPMCKYVWFLRTQWQSDRAKIMKTIKRKLGLPCFVKPANLGSSVGVSRADDKKSLERAVELAAQYDRKIVVEEAVDAREIECAVIGNNEPKASLPGEYVIYDRSAAFLDYTEKYTKTGHVEFVVPAPISKSLSTKIQKMAIDAFQSIDGAGLARVDFFLTRDSKQLLINELNTMPGLTEVSGYPKMWTASGLSYRRMLDVLVELALERHGEKLLNKTTRA